jgi:excisionase family DNA binding protein
MAGIGRTNFYRLIGEGRIRAVKCGKRTLIRADDLRAFIEGLPVLEPRKGGDQA